MASENAKVVAQKVITKVRKGEKVILGELIRESGYSEGISKQPSRVTKQDSFQKEIKPLADGLDKEIERIKKELANRDISEEKYNDLTRSMDLLIKNHQLLTGGKTSNEAISFKWEE